MSKAHRLSGNHDLNRHRTNGDASPVSQTPLRKAIAVRMDAYRMLHELQIHTEPRIDLSYFASAAIEQAFGSASGREALKSLAVSLARRDLDQLSP
jgi:hypothetical protein